MWFGQIYMEDDYKTCPVSTLKKIRSPSKDSLIHPGFYQFNSMVVNFVCLFILSCMCRAMLVVAFL